MNFKHDSTTSSAKKSLWGDSSNFLTYLGQGGFRTIEDIAGSHGTFKAKVFKIFHSSIRNGKNSDGTILKNCKSFPKNSITNPTFSYS